MWIQVRTMDGKVAHTVDSLSRLTKVEELRRKIQELFHVEPGLQRLFYRGKQVNAPCRLPPAQHLCSCLVQASYIYSPRPSSGPASRLHRNLKCLSQEQRLHLQIDIRGRTLALQSVAFGLLSLPPLFFEAPLNIISRKGSWR